MSDRFIIGSRGSRLALTQAGWVKRQLEFIYPDSDFPIEVIKTTGDVNSSSLTKIGGQGVFTKELEDALRDRRIDLAVHSLKDLPTTLSEDLKLGAICEREDPRDALALPLSNDVHHSSIRDLRPGAIVGTSSLRRLSQLKHLRGDVEVRDLRGNVDTRLRKLDEGQYDAMILAAAGLRRLGLDNRISLLISPEQMVPAVGQGALGIEIRAEDPALAHLVRRLNHSDTQIACTAERSLLRSMGGGCLLPIAAHGLVLNGELRLDGLVASADGKEVVRDRITGPGADAEALGRRLADRLTRRGAKELLKSVHARA